MANFLNSARCWKCSIFHKKKLSTYFMNEFTFRLNWENWECLQIFGSWNKKKHIHFIQHDFPCVVSGIHLSNVYLHLMRNWSSKKIKKKTKQLMAIFQGNSMPVEKHNVPHSQRYFKLIIYNRIRTEWLECHERINRMPINYF